MIIPPTVLPTIQAIIKLIQQKEIELDALKSYLTLLIKGSTGIDIDKDNWELTPETGELNGPDDNC